MDELQLLRIIQRRFPLSGNAAIIEGIGDDCAIVRPQGARADWLFTADMLIEDVHFCRETHPARNVGHKALARGLSDIAAMGGAPVFCLLSLALAKWADKRWVNEFFRGFGDLAAASGTVLAGGDLSHSDKVACDVIVCGEVPRGRALRRSGARPGDRICVSGWLGGAALGLRTGCGTAWKKHLRPEPRLDLGRYVRTKLRATAAMDLSDGLSLDLHRLALASGVSASVDREPKRFAGASLEDCLHGGEDYELLFTIPPHVSLPAAYEEVPLMQIGVIKQGLPGRVTFLGRRLPPRGYDHFRDR
jgi:thiamine-monophosphate kinase